MASENGWEPSHAGADILEWITVPGTNVRLQLMKGWPSIVMRAYAADYSAYVEPLRDPDSAGFTPTNSVATSNHLNGTAMDLNWNSHPFRVADAGYSPQMIATMREILDFYEGTMFWANNWNSPKDAMHHQMGYDTWNNPQVQDFINRKIRPDGFSTFRRGNTPPPPPQLSKQDQYALAVIAEGRRRNISPRGIQIALSVPFVESGWKMYANSNVPESMNIPHDAVGTDHDSVGLFQQRCPMWGPAEVLMDPAKSAGLFYDRLVKLNYDDTSRAPGDYAADVQRPAAQYRGRYQERMGDAVALYNRLANVTGDDELSAEAERKIDVIYQELTKKFVSRSPLRMPGEGPLDTVAGFELYTNASTDIQIVRYAASLGHPPTLNRLSAVANLDPNQYPDRADDSKLAQAILADIESEQPKQVAITAGLRGSGSGGGGTAAAPQQVVYVDRPADTTELDAARAEIERLREENARLQDSKTAGLSTAVAPMESAGFMEQTDPTTGQVIGRAYDALQQLRLADALPIEDRAPLAALISVLQTKNGAAL